MPPARSIARWLWMDLHNRSVNAGSKKGITLEVPDVFNEEEKAYCCRNARLNDCASGPIK